MQQPLVSVPMITYNHKPYICRAIECVLAQKTNFPFELVIGEDCSTDGTLDIVYDYAKRYSDRVRVVHSGSNVGMHKNLYRTEKACRGKYISYCEGDDYWHRTDKLQIQSDYLEQHPECSLVCSDHDIYFLGKDKRIKKYNEKRGMNPCLHNGSEALVRGASGIQTCTVMTRNDLLFQVIDADPILYQESTFPAGDLPRWFELAQLGEVGYINESLATYNRLDNSATSNLDFTKILRTSIQMKKLILYLVQKYDISETERKRHLRDLRMRTHNLAFLEQQPDLLKDCPPDSGQLTPIEYLYILGAKSRLCNHLLRPLPYFRSRRIPASK